MLVVYKQPAARRQATHGLMGRMAALVAWHPVLSTATFGHEMMPRHGGLILALVVL